MSDRCGPEIPLKTLAHRNRSDFCDLRLRCPSRTPEIAPFSRHQETAMPHCDLRVRWKVASDLRFRAAISEPKTPSFCGISGDLAPSTRKSLAIAIVRFWCAKLKTLLSAPEFPKIPQIPLLPARRGRESPQNSPNFLYCRPGGAGEFPGHSEKNIFNKHFQGVNSGLNSLYFPRKHPEFRRMAEFRKYLLNAMAQVFLF